MGYHRAGFEVVGVDINPQPRYPFEFHQADAMTFPLKGFDAIHASPPCQRFSPLNAYNHKEYPNLVPGTRDRLRGANVPWVIENVVQAPLRTPVILCAATFGLRLYRHRAFESSVVLSAPPHAKHVNRCVRNGYVPLRPDQFMTISGGRHSAEWCRTAAHFMGAPWMETIPEVCEAIPPAYTEWIGRQLLAAASPTEVGARNAEQRDPKVRDDLPERTEGETRA